MKTVGVLGFQGSVEEHLNALGKAGAAGVSVKTAAALNSIDGLIIPGGESTTVSRLLNIFGMTDPIREKIKSGMPVWGTCAGMILLAKNIIGGEPCLKMMDITVRRNAYGRQADSFKCRALIPEFAENPIPLVFIRAPWVEHAGENVQILCEIDGHIAAVRQNNMLAAAFHPELTENTAAVEYFLKMI